jgi:hypothetical protein
MINPAIDPCEISSKDLDALRAGCRRLYAGVTPTAIVELVQMVSRDLTAVSDAIRADLAAATATEVGEK